jgi:hypothetical protein
MRGSSPLDSPGSHLCRMRSQLRGTPIKVCRGLDPSDFTAPAKASCNDGPTYSAARPAYIQASA